MPCSTHGLGSGSSLCRLLFCSALPTSLHHLPALSRIPELSPSPLAQWVAPALQLPGGLLCPPGRPLPNSLRGVDPDKPSNHYPGLDTAGAQWRWMNDTFIPMWQSWKLRNREVKELLKPHYQWEVVSSLTTHADPELRPQRRQPSQCFQPTRQFSNSQPTLPGWPTNLVQSWHHVPGHSWHCQIPQDKGSADMTANPYPTSDANHKFRWSITYASDPPAINQRFPGPPSRVQLIF